MQRFELVSDFKPGGDQPEAIKGFLCQLEKGAAHADASWRYRDREDLYYGEHHC